MLIHKSINYATIILDGYINTLILNNIKKEYTKNKFLSLHNLLNKLSKISNNSNYWQLYKIIKKYLVE